MRPSDIQRLRGFLGVDPDIAHNHDAQRTTCYPCDDTVAERATRPNCRKRHTGEAIQSEGSFCARR